MNEHILLVYIIFFAAAFAFSLLINRFLLKFSKTLGIRNTSETVIRWSSTSKPALGGISLFIIFLFSIIVYSFIKPTEGEFFNLQSLGILISVTMGFLLGLFDDAYNTNPKIKFFTQLACGIVLALTGTYIQIFDSMMLNYLITLFWVVGIMNSINMLDNMDAITAIVSLAIMLSVLAGLFISESFIHPITIILIGSIAALSGFLFYNWHPSKMYMGDTGSQFLGVLLAALGVMFLWNVQDTGAEKNIYMQGIAIAISFALPIIDTTTVFIKRIARGQSPFVGGKDHTTHHLSYLGLTDDKVAWIFVLLSLISLLFTILITQYIQVWVLWHTVAFGSYFLVLFVILFYIANLNKEKN